jgi:hypothetical protein
VKRRVAAHFNRKESIRQLEATLAAPCDSVQRWRVVL